LSIYSIILAQSIFIIQFVYYQLIKTAIMRTTQIYIPYYTTYTHVYQLAKAIQEGAKQVPNVEVTLYRIPETLSSEVLSKLHAAPATSDPEISPELLAKADGILFGFPTRFGSLPAQVKTFLDACGGIWMNGGLKKKFAGTFIATGSQHGGQETTHLSMINFFAHNGMTYVPLGYASEHLNESEEMIGGSPYGASVIAGSDGSRQPSEKELEIARIQGREFAELVSTYIKGATLPSQTTAAAKISNTATINEKQAQKLEKSKSNSLLRRLTRVFH
jgi:NAD(P)H dehydrogenase (quinone)